MSFIVRQNLDKGKLLILVISLLIKLGKDQRESQRCFLKGEINVY